MSINPLLPRLQTTWQMTGGERRRRRERERERERESFIREEGREPPWISEKEPEREIKRDGLVHYKQIRTS